jgi:hypothetical protein
MGVAMQGAGQRVGNSVSEAVVIAPALALLAVLLAPDGPGAAHALSVLWRDVLGLPPIAAKTPFVLLHLAGLILGAGGALLLDLFVAWRLLDRGRLTAEELRICRAGSRAVAAGLALLWVSGLAFLAIYALTAPNLLENPKLWAKVAVVSILTANGFALHRLLFARMPADSVWTPPRERSVLCAGLVAVSVASWLTATIFGAVKELNGVVPFTTLAVGYGLAIAASLVLVLFIRRRVDFCGRLHQS